METIPTIVQQGTARKPLTLFALLASRFYLAGFFVLHNVLSAMSKALKRHQVSTFWRRVMVRRFLKLPI